MKDLDIHRDRMWQLLDAQIEGWRDMSIVEFETVRGRITRYARYERDNGRITVPLHLEWVKVT